MSCLDDISDWPERAARAHFRISLLAANCGVSERHLRRFIKLRFGQLPHLWLLGHRLAKAPELLQQNFLLNRSPTIWGSQAKSIFRESSNGTSEFLPDPIRTDCA
jgi:methylphosphotriester-DNA--protein-cysteine methyltransferase